jgi:predicted lipase
MGLIVSFEGTKSSSLTSVLNDLMIGLAQPMQGLQWLPQGTRLSQGFQNSWSISAQPLLRELRSLLKRYDNPTVWITGHSLGGATALISALHLNHYLDADIKLVTFGMPRVGNKMVRLKPPFPSVDL